MSTNLDTATAPLMDTQPIRKFLFERSFDEGYTEPKQPEKPKPIYTADQLEAAKREAYEEGLQAGRKAAIEDYDTQTRAIVETFGGKLDALMEAGAAGWADQNAEMQAIAVMIARKALPVFVERGGLAEIQALFEQVVREVGREPRLVVRVAESQFDTVNAMVKEISEQRAYAGQVVLLADPDMTVSDCRIEWADGGIERNMKDLWQRLDAIIEKPPIAAAQQPTSSSGDET